MKIHEYAAKGDCHGLRSELAKGISVDVRDEQDLTPLALVSNHVASDEPLQLLLDSGTDINAVVREGKSSPLGLAACSGNLRYVDLLLNAGASIHFESPKGYSILLNTVFALHGDERLVPMIESLLRHGADSNTSSEYGESPLSIASRLGRFDAVECLLEAGADPSPLHWTEFMRAVAFGTCDDMKKLLSGKSVPDEWDRWERTPWLISVVARDLEKAKLLLAAGADINDQDRGGRSALMYCATNGDTPMLRWLIEAGAEIEGTDGMSNTALMLAAQAGQTDSVKLLLEKGANPHRQDECGQNVISMASNEEIVRLLVAAGADLGSISTEMKRKLLGLQDGEALDITKAEYKSGCRPRFGKSNPEVMDIPLWKEMVRAGINAYHAKKQFGDEHNMSEPTWCFSRFGMSFTELPDGRFVQIGGEHEDFYDSDFCIYNEVIVHEKNGKFQIMGYPKDVFPPTDFHTATLVDHFIYIVGGLGYQGSRWCGLTPVFRLNCRTWKMESLESSGENPGWIHRHTAKLVAPDILIISGGEVCLQRGGQEQFVENKESFQLDLSSMKWVRC